MGQFLSTIRFDNIPKNHAYLLLRFFLPFSIEIITWFLYRMNRSMNLTWYRYHQPPVLLITPSTRILLDFRNSSLPLSSFFWTS
jgi:hypothetical protein